METMRAAPETTGNATEAPTPASCEELLVSTFNAIRDDLVSTLVYLLGNQDDALDAAQDAFLKCWRSRTSVGEVQNLRAWIFRVGLNAAKDFQRSAWKRRSRAIAGDETMIMGRENSPGQYIEDREDLEKLRKAILELRQDEKEVFLLRQNGSLTYEQIAEIRSSPVGTVKTQMRSALQKLRQKLS